MEIKLVPLTSENYSEIVHVNNAELPDLATIKWYEEKSTPNTVLLSLAGIASNGSYVGYGRYVSGTWDPILKPGYAEVSVKVANAWGNQGIDSTILNELENLATEDNAHVLQTNIADNQEERLNWFKAHGFEMSGHTYESHLELKTFNNTQYEPHLQDIGALGIRFTTLADFLDVNASNHRFWDLWWELVQDVPGMEGKPRPENDQMIRLVKDFDKKGFIIATAGERWVALSMIVKENDDFCYNSMTGVIQEYRGKGLATAIKIKAIEYAQNNQVKFIRTHNDSKNKPMVALNKKLGYQSKTGIYSLIKDISKL